VEQRLVAGAAADAVRERAIRELLAAWQAAGASVLIVKGLHLAYRLYPLPHLRPRDDSDVLVEPAGEHAAAGVLISLGYHEMRQLDDDAVSGQRSYVLTRDGQRVHVVDLHRRLSNPATFASVFSFDELLASAEALPALGPGARVPAAREAWLIAAVHRAAHHGNRDRLIWVHDLWRLGTSFGPDDWSAVASTARARGMLTVAREAAATVREYFGDHGAGDEVARLFEGPLAAERSARYAVAGRQARRVLVDLSALRTWRGRWRLIRAHAWPSRAYMRTTYAPGSRAPLVWLYARRAAIGLRRWLSRA
jgi:hypothetical protein